MNSLVLTESGGAILIYSGGKGDWQKKLIPKGAKAARIKDLGDGYVPDGPSIGPDDGGKPHRLSRGPGQKTRRQMSGKPLLPGKVRPAVSRF